MSGEQATLLMIDDEEDLLYQFESLFRSFENIRFLTASDAKTGIAIARKEQPRVIMLDYRMPRMDGEEALKELKALLPECKFIVMTGWEDGLTRDRLERIGVDAYFPKPFNLEEVLNKILGFLKT